MGWTTKLLLLSLLGLSACQQRSLNGGRRRQRISAGKSEIASFNCPQDFGYYPHPSDCTQYYVCVFGGALQESCTGGLVYSHELETCDWPRNVECTPSAAGSGIAPVRSTDQRPPNSSPVRTATESLTPSVGSFDSRFEHSYTPKDSRSPQKFDGNDRSNSPRALFRQQPNPKQSLASPRFSQQSFFDTSVQESSQRPVNAKPTTFRPQVFSSNTRRPTSVKVTSRPLVDDAFYADLNFTDPEYFYYYDDLLYDYYDIGTPAASPATLAPAPRPAPTRVPIRTPTRQSSSTNRGPPRGASSSGTPSVGSTVPKRPAPVRPHPPADTKATKCDPKVCVLPDCYCGGKDIPDGISPSETPQIVLLTFDDSVNDLNKDLYTELFENGRLNPNGCPIVSTMYVSHEWTDYSQVQNLYAAGHEMASHSIQHSFGEQFSTTKWAKEIAGQREILAAYGGVKMEDVRGMRAPFLAVGGNKMFRMLYDQNFTYDSSMPVYENNPPSWPYTLDYRIFHDCMIPPCPTNSYPGLWQVPMVMWQDLNGGRCSMGDACTTPPDAEGVYKMLIKNFERHYTTNRAPFGLFYHAAWFTTPHHKEGFIAFLDTITAMDDVWLTTNWQLIQWMRDPTPLSRINSFGPFGCNFPDRPRCTTKNVCNVWHKGGVRYMRTCQQCPETYPWTGNTGVRSPLNDS
ncbi:chitin deacetylase 1 isoform X15 [Panulirus ornatus]|uniref:chitin deacetylase 1 isoform X15 n=1 Tax=Panulirus ornatus TaxID=150431 RepID=UPI003A8AC541